VQLGFRQTTEVVISGFEAAWAFFGGVFKVVIPENVPRNIFGILCPTALCGSSGNRPEAVLVTSRCRSFRGT
jgi:hypothetical protein